MTSKLPHSLQQQIEQYAPELILDYPKIERLGTPGSLLLAQLLQEHGENYRSILKLLSIGNSGLSSEGLLALLSALFSRARPSELPPALLSHHYHALETLSFRSNSIGSRGLKALSQLLLHDEQIKVLDLYDNSIGNQAVRPLLESLRINRTLRCLNLWYNRLSSNLSPTLGSAIRFNCGLRNLLLGGNDLGEETAEAFKQALQTNVTLCEVDLSGNTMSVASMESVMAVLRRNLLRRRIKAHAAERGLYHCHVPLPTNGSAETSSTAILKQLTSSGHFDVAPDTLSPDDARHGTFIILKAALERDESLPSLQADSPSSTTSPSPTSISPSNTSVSPWTTSSNNSSHSLLLQEPKAFLSSFLTNGCEIITRLSLAGTHLRVIPLELVNLPRLVQLDLRDNFVTEIPSQISQLQQLKALLVSHNRLESLPNSIVLLTQLESWALHANPLSLIPKIYLETSLFADNPQKTALWRYFASIRLGGSQEIRLQKAKVMIVGDANVGKTSLLHCLQTNFGSVFTRWIHKLPKPLATDGIDIEAVKIRLSGNSSTSKASSVAIATSFSSSSLSSTASMNTQTSNTGYYSPSSTSPQFSPPSMQHGFLHGPSPSTPTSPLTTTTAGSASFNTPTTSLNAATAINYEVWDFAGQDVYYTTHSFFLTPNTIYLVVFDLTRIDAAQLSRIDYWIQSIQTRAGTALSYILLVGSHLDESNPTDAGELIATLTRRWVISRDVLDICSISCKTGEGIEGLKKVLNATATKFGLACQVYPKSWLQIGEVLKGIKGTQPWIPYDKLSEICRQFYVTPSTLDMGVLPALKDLGIVLHFSSDPQLQDTVFINPQFIIKAFADVLTIKHRGFIKSDGILHTKDLQLLWQAERRHFSDKVLVQLFLLFDVAIQLDPNRLLVPALLSNEAPETLKQHWPYGLSELEDLRSELEKQRPIFRRDYTFKFLPLGFFSKVIAQCYRNLNWDIQCHWKSGIVVRNPSSGEIGLATFNDENFILKLRISGERYSSLLAQFVLLIDTLIKGWYPNATCVVTIPIPNEERTRFYEVPREEIMDAVRSSSDSKAVISVPSSDEFRWMVSHRVDLIAPDLTLAGMRQLSEEELERDLLRVKLLGRGGQGTVHQGVWKEKTKVAVKDFEVVLGASEDDFDTQQEWLNHKRAAQLRAQLTLQQEALILKNARHPNIVRLIGFNIPKLLMLLDFISLGHIESYLKSSDDLIAKSSSNNPTSSYTDTLASSSMEETFRTTLDYELGNAKLQTRIALDIASAMAYLHQLKPAILHRDLAANNIVLDSMDIQAPVVAKLVDFGTASFIGKAGLGSYHNEKRYCLSPEVIEERDHTHKSDVYSFGILMWQLWSGRFDHGLSPKDVVRGQRPPTDSVPIYWSETVTKSPIASARYVELMSRTWNGNPELRPEFSEILDHLVAIGIELGMEKSLLIPYTTSLHHGVELSDIDAMTLESSSVGSETGSLRQISLWQELCLFSVMDEEGLSDSNSNFLSCGERIPTGPEVTSIAYAYDTLFVGTSDGMLRLVHPSGVKNDERPAVSQRVAVLDDALTSILPLSSKLVVCMSGSALALVENGVVKEKLDILAGALLVRATPNSVLVSTSVGTIKWWQIRPFKKLVSAEVSIVEKIIGIHKLEFTTCSETDSIDDIELEEAMETDEFDERPSLWLVVTETAIFFLSLPSFELKMAHSFSKRQSSRIVASHVHDTACWVACTDGSVRSYKVQLGTYTMIEGVNLSLHSNRICMISSAPNSASHEISRRMVTIGEDVMLCWNPDSQELVEQPLRFRSLAPISYAIVLSGTSIISASRKMGKVVLWRRPSNFGLDDSDSC